MENMHVADMFDERKMTEWEDKPEADKTWAQAKTYFGTLYKKRMYLHEGPHQILGRPQ